MYQKLLLTHDPSELTYPYLKEKLCSHLYYKAKLVKYLVFSLDLFTISLCSTLVIYGHIDFMPKYIIHSKRLL